MSGSGVPAYQEPITNAQGVTSRTWYRFLTGLKKNNGSLAEPIVVKPNSFFVSGTLDSGDTLEPNTIPAGTVLGNSSDANATASPQVVGGSLFLNNGTLEVAKQATNTLFGNAGNTSAVPSEVAIGSGLSITPGSPPVLNVVPDANSGTDLASAQTLSWWRGG